MNVNQYKQRKLAAGFTLLEVIIALAIFFTAVVAVLELTSQNLRLAQTLLQKRPDIGALASATMLDKELSEGFEEPVDPNFEEMFPGCKWDRDVVSVSSNGLYRVTINLFESTGGGELQTTTSFLMYRPDLATGTVGVR